MQAVLLGEAATSVQFAGEAGNREGMLLDKQLNPCQAYLL